MDEDSIYRRVNILLVQRLVKEQYHGSSDAPTIARAMVRVLNKKVAAMVDAFEHGEGDFSACYFDAVRDIDGK
ncbi:MAG: hypothetical protein HZC28_09815 [Spirochaetes bacterium]|nr:hypothetical protein [Spirochaetota bacterium]